MLEWCSTYIAIHMHSTCNCILLLIIAILLYYYNLQCTLAF